MNLRQSGTLCHNYLTCNHLCKFSLLKLVPFLCRTDAQDQESEGVVTAVVAVETACAHPTVRRKDEAIGQDGHACIASAETSRSSFSVAPLAA